MLPYEKLHKLLQPVQVIFMLITMMILCRTVENRNCNGAVRTIQLFSPISKGHVRVEGRKIVANSSSNYMEQTLQMITVDRHYFLLYDPKARMFICWNRMYTNLLPRRNPKNLAFCKFEEKPSLIHPRGLTRYTTTIPNRQSSVTGKRKEVELRFNRAGAFAYPAMVRKCFEKWKWFEGGGTTKKSRKLMNKHHLRHSHHHHPNLHQQEHQRQTTFNVNLVLNILDSVDSDPEARKVYGYLSKHCAGPDFIVHLVQKSQHHSSHCSSAYLKFCQQMQRIHRHHRLHSTLVNFCRI